MIFTSTSKFKTLGIGFLGILMTLNPATGCAQMEINPDHYETVDVSAAASKANSNRSASRPQGKSSPAFQKPSAGTRNLRSRRVSTKRPAVQLSAKTEFADHSWDIR